MSLSRVEISKSALLHNIAQIRKHLRPNTKFIAAVKSNAYGHDLFQVVNTIKSEVDMLAVYDFADAMLLRRKKVITPIMVLGPISSRQIVVAVRQDLEISISDFTALQAIQNKNLSIHLCIDSGLGRDGFTLPDIKKVLALLQNSKINVKGLYSHFSVAQDIRYTDYTKNQVEQLLVWKKALAEIGIKPLVHLSATAGIFITDFETEFDAVRIGGGIYGLLPEEFTKIDQKKSQLLQVLSWKTKIIELKNLPQGSYISYGHSFALKRDSKIAIIPVGYFDGIPRIVSNKAKVSVNGIKVPQIGRVTMNMTIIDVTDVKDVGIDDVVTIIGCDKNVVITVDDWGKWSESFNYEITTRINPDLPRILV